VFQNERIQNIWNSVPYKARIGSLMYAMVATRDDIVFEVNSVSKFMLKAGPPHWMAMKHIMRYLKGTLDFELCFKDKNIALRGF